MSAFLFESRRLGYREFTPDDANALYRLNADPEVIRYTGYRFFRSAWGKGYATEAACWRKWV